MGRVHVQKRNFDVNGCMAEKRGEAVDEDAPEDQLKGLQCFEMESGRKCGMHALCQLLPHHKAAGDHWVLGVVLHYLQHK